MIGVLVAVLWVTAGLLPADYLEVRRNATLKAEPSGAADVLGRAEPGTLLGLASGTRQNGY